MALPTTISNVSLAVRGVRRVGPWISSGGNVYVVLLNSADLSLIEVYKATDPTSSFAEQDSANGPNLTNVVESISAVQVSDVIHIAALEASTGRVSYHTFNMATDAWAIVNEQVVATTSVAAQPLLLDLMVRSDGDVIVAYSGTSETVTMNAFKRVDYARRESASWTTDIAVDNGGSVDWAPGCVVPGSSDRTHIFFLDDSNDDAYQRCLLSDNTLETFPAAFDAAIQSSANRADVGVGTAYLSGGTTKVRCPYEDGTGITMALCDSADTPTVTTSNLTTTIARRSLSAQTGAYLIAAVAKGTDLYALFVDSTSEDLYRDLNANDAGWGTDTATFTGTVYQVSANVFVRSGNYKLAYVLDDAGTIKYDEDDLGVAAQSRLVQPLRLNQAVQRASYY